MKLAEALAERAEVQRRLEQLRQRAIESARYQEGEEPSENADQLLAEAAGVADRLETLIRQINATNAATEIEPGLTVTDAIAKRDVLKLRHRLVTGVAGAATKPQRGRQIRSELRYISAVSVADLHTEADSIAQELRVLDSRIQQRNWETELIT